MNQIDLETLQLILKEATEAAVTDTFNRDRPITIIYGNSMVRVFPNNRTYFIKAHVTCKVKRDKRIYKLSPPDVNE